MKRRYQNNRYASDLLFREAQIRKSSQAYYARTGRSAPSKKRASGRYPNITAALRAIQRREEQKRK